MDYSKIEYRISIKQDDTPVRGNAMASGDGALDKRVEDEILARLDRGDVWAWAQVTVVASIEGFKGYDYLGCCSYEDEEDFKKDGGYYLSMQRNARQDLIAVIEDARERIARVDGGRP